MGEKVAKTGHKRSLSIAAGDLFGYRVELGIIIEAERVIRTRGRTPVGIDGPDGKSVDRSIVLRDIDVCDSIHPVKTLLRAAIVAEYAGMHQHAA